LPKLTFDKSKSQVRGKGNTRSRSLRGVAGKTIQVRLNGEVGALQVGSDIPSGVGRKAHETR